MDSSAAPRLPGSTQILRPAKTRGAQDDNAKVKLKSEFAAQIESPKPAARYFSTPRCATPILSRVVFFTKYIISSA